MSSSPFEHKRARKCSIAGSLFPLAILIGASSVFWTWRGWLSEDAEPEPTRHAAASKPESRAPAAESEPLVNSDVVSLNNAYSATEWETQIRGAILDSFVNSKKSLYLIPLVNNEHISKVYATAPDGERTRIFPTFPHAKIGSTLEVTVGSGDVAATIESLVEYDVRYLHITSPSENELAAAAHLTELESLSFTSRWNVRDELSMDVAYYLRDLPKLSSLSIHGSYPLRTINTDAILALPHLKELHLMGRSWGEEIEEGALVLADFTQIEVLTLASEVLPLRYLHEAGKLTNLRKLILIGIIEDERNTLLALREALPDCEIEVRAE